MTRWSLMLGCLWLLPACAGSAESMSLDELISRHTLARGGAEAIESVRSIEIRLRIVEPTFHVDGRYVATREGRMRIDILQDGQHVFTEALDGEHGWSWSPGAASPTEGSAQGNAALRHGMEFPFKLYGLHELQRRGHRLDLLGMQMLDGIDYYQLQLTLDDGFQVQYFLNPESWLIERSREARALHVDIDPEPQWIETVFSDYRPTGGVLYPWHQVERKLDSGEVLSTGTVTAIEINPSLDVACFRAP
jgi:hypothetical protein